MDEMPLGLEAALARNEKARAYFDALPVQEQRQMMARARSCQSRRELRAFVQGLAGPAGRA